jgi:mannose-6-phosphate isomerase-like protein (cupin superfamily)
MGPVETCDPRWPGGPVCGTDSASTCRVSQAAIHHEDHSQQELTAARPWGALDIANMGGITTRLHWTDQPYKWHVNDGEEVFAVLDGRVEMRYREGGVEQSAILETGDVFYASVGTEHVAHPIGAARILVVEAEGSV